MESFSFCGRMRLFDSQMCFLTKNNIIVKRVTSIQLFTTMSYFTEIHNNVNQTPEVRTKAESNIISSSIGLHGAHERARACVCVCV